MSPLFYATHIGTLAIWLSVVGFGTVGLVNPSPWDTLDRTPAVEPHQELESTVFTEEFVFSEQPPLPETNPGTAGEAEETEVLPAAQETLPAPPEMPEVPETTSLPEIPTLPPLATTPTETSAPQPRPVPQQTRSTPTRPSIPTRPTGGSPTGKPATKEKPGGGGNGPSALSDAQRLASGYKPRPSYPSSSRSRGHTGTVVVEFVIEENGRVLSASVQKSSGWPELDQSAVANMRRWKFAPGKRDKRTIPIVFKLK